MCRSAQRSIVGHSSPTTQHSSPTYPPAHISLHVCSYLPVYHVQAVAGDHAYLPCDIATVDDPQGNPDSVILVLWYREDVGTPIFRAWCKSKSRKGIYIKDEMIQEHINHLSKNITQQQMSDS
ncbi:hypothetical protein J6590_057064 [Homalodisca vitripennis]|nr:hypothetical protein J6590_057064 [Homalodisca vitripennis]